MAVWASNSRVGGAGAALTRIRQMAMKARAAARIFDILVLWLGILEVGFGV